MICPFDSVLVERWLASPRESVFRAFVEPRLLERWFCPAAEVRMQVEACDPRPGGTYRFVFSFPDGSARPVIGVYQVVEPPGRLVFTWTWEPPDIWAGVETLVTVGFEAKDGGTLVSVHHERFTTPEMKSSHEKGWAGTLVRLEGLEVGPG